MTFSRTAVLLSALHTAAAQSVSCGNTYTFSIDRPGQRWRPRFCRWGHFTLYTCGAGKANEHSGCPASVGTLTDTVIDGACRSDNAWGTANSCCSQVASGCSNLDIGAAKGGTGWAKLTVCCEGCPSCSWEPKQLPAARWSEPALKAAEDAIRAAEDTIIPEETAPANMSAAYQSPDLQPDGVSDVGVDNDLRQDLAAMGPKKSAAAGTKFFLPLHKEVSLITCDKLEVLGRAIPSAVPGDTEQWFGQVRVVHHGHEVLGVQPVMEDKREELLKMETVQPEKAQGSVSAPVDKWALGSLDVTIEGAPINTTTAAVTAQAQLVVVSRQEGRIGSGWVESVTFSDTALSLELRSAVAHKFLSERNRVDHLHVDMQVTFLDFQAGCTGVLPEMWGLAKMTSATARMLQPPALEAANPDVPPASTSEIHLSSQGSMISASTSSGGGIWG